MTTTPTARRWLLASVTLVVAIVSADPSAAKPARSGSIVTGFYIPHQGLGPVPTCDTVPTCAAWQASGCSASLAGREPAVGASIVSVRELADGRTRRRFGFSMGGPTAWSWGVVTLQLWRRDCVEIPWSQMSVRRPNSFGGCTLGGTDRRRCGTATFVIPRATAWMTVTPTADNVNIDWSLT